MPANYEIIPYGDSAFLVRFDVENYSEAVSDHIHALIKALRPHDTWEELVPGYTSLLAYFCPYKTEPATAQAQLRKLLNKVQSSGKIRGRVIDIPVCYGDEFGPDMDQIMTSSGFTKKEVISSHSRRIYKVCMMGFIPGFTFLSPAPKALHHDRHTTPRAKVASGSVGIAGWQTGIYGLESPGGWQIIGRTPLKIFDAERDRPFLISAGDRVRFKPISEKAFNALAENE